MNVLALTPSVQVLRHRPYAHFLTMRVLLAGARQMEAVAIGWQVYDLARLDRTVEESALLLGLIGLTQFVPVLLFSLIGGQVADRLDPKKILIATNTARFLATVILLATAFLAPRHALPSIFAVAVILGTVNAFVPAAANTLYPRLVPRAELPAAIAWNSLGFQSAAIAGPALGGVLYIGGPETVYGVSLVLIGLALLAIATAKTPKHIPPRRQRGLAMMKEGLLYVRGNKIVLGAISLDLVVVFFAGATALLPIFARDVLHVGTEGLGALRAAPAFGAGLVALGLAFAPLTQAVGRWMMAAIFVYGLSMLAFGLSTSFVLSLAALGVSGAADMVSMYVRQSLIQLATPDGMRGRVSSVSFIFVSASNELGEFESGVAARLLGPVGAVVLGGTAAIVTALAWFKLFPALTRADRFDELPGEAPAPAAGAPAS
ncbi:MFS transporter [Parvularcula dongshanensis]|uniref:MFS transporter n=1 Tax=Parvularcula dongshanensis TaxID=1173995 RepID=UPI003CCCA5B8